MNNDNQIKHHIWWIYRTMGKLPDTYAEFQQQDLSQEVCEEIDALVAHIKENY